MGYTREEMKEYEEEVKKHLERLYMTGLIGTFKVIPLQHLVIDGVYDQFLRIIIKVKGYNFMQDISLRKLETPGLQISYIIEDMTRKLYSDLIKKTLEE